MFISSENGRTSLFAFKMIILPPFVMLMHLFPSFFQALSPEMSLQQNVFSVESIPGHMDIALYRDVNLPSLLQYKVWKSKSQCSLIGCLPWLPALCQCGVPSVTLTCWIFHSLLASFPEEMSLKRCTTTAWNTRRTSAMWQCLEGIKEGGTLWRSS